MEFMSIVEKNIKSIVIVFLVLVIGGGSIALVSNKSKTKEKEAQEVYFLTEKKYFELKEKNEKSATKDKVDFSDVKSGFLLMIEKYPKSVAAQMSAIHLANILSSEGKQIDALNNLKKVENSTKGMVNFLVSQQIGLLFADTEKCQDAIVIWQSLIDKKEASFLHNELKLQQALCYSKTNDLKKAEEILTNLSNQTANPDLSESNVPKEAEKFLRLLQFKKVSGT
jgi:hypothetical protein